MPAGTGFLTVIDTSASEVVNQKCSQIFLMQKSPCAPTGQKRGETVGCVGLRQLQNNYTKVSELAVNSCKTFEIIELFNSSAYKYLHQRNIK